MVFVQFYFKVARPTIYVFFLFESQSRHIVLFGLPLEQVKMASIVFFYFYDINN